MKNKSTLCWTCSNFNNCSWHRNLTPVKGWKAEEVLIKADKVKTFLVIDCPEYILEKPTVKAEIKNDFIKMAKENGISIRTIFRWKQFGVLNENIKKLKEKNKKQELQDNQNA